MSPFEPPEDVDDCEAATPTPATLANEFAYDESAEEDTSDSIDNPLFNSLLSFCSSANSSSDSSLPYCSPYEGLDEFCRGNGVNNNNYNNYNNTVQPASASSSNSVVESASSYSSYIKPNGIPSLAAQNSPDLGRNRGRGMVGVSGDDTCGIGGDGVLRGGKEGRTADGAYGREGGGGGRGDGGETKGEVTKDSSSHVITEFPVLGPESLASSFDLPASIAADGFQYDGPKYFQVMLYAHYTQLEEMLRLLHSFQTKDTTTTTTTLTTTTTTTIPTNHSNWPSSYAYDRNNNIITKVTNNVNDSPNGTAYVHRAAFKKQLASLPRKRTTSNPDKFTHAVDSKPFSATNQEGSFLPSMPLKSTTTGLSGEANHFRSLPPSPIKSYHTSTPRRDAHHDDYYQHSRFGVPKSIKGTKAVPCHPRSIHMTRVGSAGNLVNISAVKPTLSPILQSPSTTPTSLTPDNYHHHHHHPRRPSSSSSTSFPVSPKVASTNVQSFARTVSSRGKDGVSCE